MGSTRRRIAVRTSETRASRGVAIMGKPMPMVPWIRAANAVMPAWVRTVMSKAVSIGVTDLSAVIGSTRIRATG